MQTKPKLTAVQLVKKMDKEKGIKFQLISRTQAVKFMSERNNYLRIASYRKNYQKYNGKYCNLDFKYLVELSTLDMYFRNLIMKMTINIEHCLKVRFVRDIELDSLQDGYSIVNEFLNDSRYLYIRGDLERKSHSQYSGELIKHYFKYYCDDNGIYKYDMPVWVLTEIVSFGEFMKLYRFYYTEKAKVPIDPSLLESVRSLRNACAHNNCILHDLKPSDTTFVKSVISNTVKKITSIGQEQRRKKLSNRFIMEFVTLLYVYDKIISDEIKKPTYKELENFAAHRLIRNIDYFDNQQLIKTSIEFLVKVIDFFAK